MTPLRLGGSGDEDLISLTTRSSFSRVWPLIAGLRGRLSGLWPLVGLRGGVFGSAKTLVCICVLEATATRCAFSGLFALPMSLIGGGDGAIIGGGGDGAIFAIDITLLAGG